MSFKTLMVMGHLPFVCGASKSSNSAMAQNLQIPIFWKDGKFIMVMGIHPFLKNNSEILIEV
jgi:hypothetical protein